MKNVIILILALLMINTTFANNTRYSLSVVSNKQHKVPHSHPHHVFIDSTLITIINSDEEGALIHSTYNNENIDLGYNLIQTFNIPIRAELVINLKDNAIKNGTTGFCHHKLHQLNQEQHNRLHTVMLNAYYDFYNDSKFTPYVSLGIGAGVIKFNHQTRFLGSKTIPNDTVFDLLKNNNSHLVYALGLGSSYFITPHWSADIGAKYFYGGHNEDYNSALNSQPNKKIPLNSVDVAFGMTYRF